MTIAINSSHFIPFDGNDLYHDYLIRIAAARPGDRFVFIVRKQPAATLVPASNITFIISSPVANQPVMWKLWLDFTLPALARKHQADLLIHTGGVGSLRTKIAQWIFISDLSFLTFPQFFSRGQLQFLKRRLPAFLPRATKIITASPSLMQEITKQYAVDENRITVFQLAAGGQYRPAGFEEKEALKEKYTEGKEYFLFNGEIAAKNNLLQLLKAFSFFKQRQKSNMQLVITTGALSSADPFIKNLKTYKYRKEVKLLTGAGEDELAKIIAGAYAFIYPAACENVPVYMFQAMQSGVPVISGCRESPPPQTGEVALYTDPGNFEDIADKMMLLFKDENRRAALIRNGYLLIQKIRQEDLPGLIAGIDPAGIKK